MLRSLLEQESKLNDHRVFSPKWRWLLSHCAVVGKRHMRTPCLLRTLSLHSYLAKHQFPPKEREAITAEHRETGVLSTSYWWIPVLILSHLVPPTRFKTKREHGDRHLGSPVQYFTSEKEKQVHRRWGAPLPSLQTLQTLAFSIILSHTEDWT